MGLAAGKEEMIDIHSERTALRVASLITTLNVAVMCGFSIVGVLSPSAILPPGASTTMASEVFALYAAARTVPLTLITLATIGPEALDFAVGMLAGVVQLLDAGVGLFQHDVGKTIGPLLIAVLQFLALLNRTRSTGRSPASVLEH